MLFPLALAGSLPLVVGPLSAQGLGHPAAPSDHLEPTCALTTVGALGARLESDDEVRESACTHRSGQPAH